jgi:5-methylthioadenosine/S-adenosylhomocysteine deaminase
MIDLTGVCGMKQVDWLVYPSWILPIEPQSNLILEKHALAVDAGKIVDLLPEEEAKIIYRAEQELVLANHALMPGFVNAHTHSPMCYFRSLADDLPLIKWLQEYIWPLEKQWVSEKFVRDAAMLAIAEMIRSGTTCFNEHYFFPETIGEVAQQVGIKARVGIPILNFETPWSKTPSESIEKGLGVFEQFKQNSLVSVGWAPHAPYTVSDQFLSQIAQLAEKEDTTIHIHVHETEDEIKQSLKTYKMRPIKRLQQLGVLSSRTQMVHMTKINQEDLNILRSTKAHVVHCPESNLKLASGFCPVQMLLDHHINVALGTDGAASNNDLNMMGEMRIASLVAKGIAKNPEALKAHQTLRMASLNGARALGFERQMGSLIVGKSADMISIDLADLSTQPIYDPISQIVYAAHRRQVSNVWVAGKQLLMNGQLTTIDETAVIKKANEWRQILQHSIQSISKW